jgi:hypothetical protein
MKFTLEHALILILAIALIYYVIQHSNLVKDIIDLPERDHPELKRVKDQHGKSTGTVSCDEKTKIDRNFMLDGYTYELPNVIGNPPKSVRYEWGINEAGVEGDDDSTFKCDRVFVNQADYEITKGDGTKEWIPLFGLGEGQEPIPDNLDDINKAMISFCGKLCQENDWVTHDEICKFNKMDSADQMKQQWHDPKMPLSFKCTGGGGECSSGSC